MIENRYDELEICSQCNNSSFRPNAPGTVEVMPVHSYPAGMGRPPGYP